jgi:osmotically-inducible protein OsmY
MSWNDDLAGNVRDELSWDPKVDAAAVAVSADDGAVTLRGTVGSLREKREATRDAERVYGVIAVHNQLQVRLLNDAKRDDAELRGDVLQALMLDSLVPPTVDVTVQDSYVTLTGTADSQYQRDEAEWVAANVVGALDVFDEIRVTHPSPTPDEHSVKDGIKKAFKRNAKLDADDLSISTSPGTVTIEGTVSSWAEHDEALAAAWAAPGVTTVNNLVTVDYS